MAKTRTADPDIGVVLLEELAARTGGSLEVASYWVERVGAPVLRDWAGRECVAAADARKAVEAYEAEVREHEEREAERLAKIRAWEEERRRVFEEAFARSLAEAASADLEEMIQREGGFWTFPTGRPTPGPKAHAIARERASQAAAEWERRHPRPA